MKLNFKFTVLYIVLFFLLSCESLNKKNETGFLLREPSQSAVTDLQPKSQSFSRLVDYKPYKYELLFTDPDCGLYEYTSEVKSFSGKVLKSKPKDVFCKKYYDLKKSGERINSPQYRLVEWIKDTQTKEIFFAYLSFSNKAVKNALCEAGKRGVKINFVISSQEDKTISDELISCAPENINLRTRGFEGGINYAHNKILIINPNSKGEIKLVFSSGNMTSGPVLHHENWHFITTHSDSYFAQAHQCLMNSVWSEESGRSMVKYIDSIKFCRSQINAPEESDIKTFFVPGEGEKKSSNRLSALDHMLNGDGVNPGINNAEKIWIGSHRFSYKKMLLGLEYRLKKFKKPEMKILLDDDTYYGYHFPEAASDVQPNEFVQLNKLVSKGAQVKYLETNSKEHLLHHSKYLLFANNKKSSMPDRPYAHFKALLAGSANLTTQAFTTNFENIYYITIPEVVEKFAQHFDETWNTKATETEDLPNHPDAELKVTEKPKN